MATKIIDLELKNGVYTPKRGSVRFSTNKPKVERKQKPKFVRTSVRSFPMNRFVAVSQGFGIGMGIVSVISDIFRKASRL